MREYISSITLNPAIDKTIIINDFKLNSLNRVQESIKTPGSKGVNVAKMLSVCGIKTLCFGLIGTDGADYIEGELSKSGAVCDFLKGSYPVRTNTKIIDLKNETCTEINYNGAAINESVLDKLFTKTAQTAKNSRIMALGGSMAPGLPDDLYYKLILIAKSEGAKVSVDCCSSALVKAVEAKPFIIKPNIEELEDSFKIKCSTYDKIVNTAANIYKKGVENVLVSLGNDGAIAVCGGSAWRVYADDIKVFSPVGAGDAFLSGFIYAADKGFDTCDCLKFALSFSQVRVSSRPDEDLTLDKLCRYVNTAKCELISEQV